MSNTTADSTIEEDGDDTAPTPEPTDDGVDPQSSTVRRYLAWGTLAVCSLLALFALVQFYGSMTAAIDLWVEPRHQPLMRAAFNLVVLLASLVGVSLVVRELS